MFITESFNSQLDDLLERICSKLQITPTQHEQAEGRYKAIGDWLEAEGSPLAHAKPVIYPQGSLRIGTTVRPLTRQEYDLDLVCEFELDWRRIPNPVVLLDVVEARLKAHETYRTMLKRKNRCIRVKYANQFHLDILPGCPDPDSGFGCLLVPDREAKDWKPSNPKGYAIWFESRTALLEEVFAKRVEPLPGPEPIDLKTPLKRVVQLLKRWRDVAYAKNSDGAPISIVLTTLAGNFYSGQESVSKALADILDRIVANLPLDGGRLIVRNPTNPDEDLSERWGENPNAYRAFVSGIIALRKSWHEVNQQGGIHRVTATLQRLFGEDLAESVVKEQAEFIEQVRSQQRLGVQRGSGVLTSVTAAGSMPVRPNTFHGE